MCSPPRPAVQVPTAAFHQLPVSSLILDADARILYANPSFERLTGYREAEVVGRSCREILQGPGTDPATGAAIDEHLASGREFRGEILNYRADGSPFWNLLTFSPLRNGAGDVQGFVTAQLDVSADVAERQRSAERLETSELLRATAARLATATRRGTIIETVAQAILPLGVERSSVVLLGDDRSTLRIAGHAGWPPELQERIGRYGTSAARPELADIIARPRPVLVDPDSGSDWARAACQEFELTGWVMVPIWAEDDDAAPEGLLAGYWASTAPPAAIPRLLEERLTALAGLAAVALRSMAVVDRARRAADQDALTGLATRARLHRHLTEALEGPAGAAAVIYGDIDRFKRINDSLGHLAGDQLLAAVAARLEAVIDGSGLLGRPGGDEFVAVLPGPHTADDLQHVVQRLEAALDAPFELDGRPIYVSLSLGRSSGARSTDQPAGELAEALMESADTDMYRVKQRLPAVPTSYGGLDPLRLDSELHRAVELHGITAHFQPQFDARTGRLTAYEALARWHHPELGAVEPSLFIPLAEGNGLIRALGRQILQQACRFAEAAAERGVDVIRVNVSTRELADPDYAQDVVAILAEHPGRSWRLGLEITESALILDRGLVQDQLALLRRHGVVIGIDDFGTGYSSLSQLQDLPISELKIDRAFVQREGALASSLLRAIINLAHGLGLVVVAEGVETPQQLAALQQLDCDRVQGHLLARPMAAEAALAVPDALPPV